VLNSEYFIGDIQDRCKNRIESVFGNVKRGEEISVF